MPSNVVDERIVAAKFDSSQFEKGVDKTIKKLDELKKSLKLKDSDESITEISKKTSEATKSMSENMDKLTERITSFTGMLKQKLLSGIADEIVSVFFKMENAIKSFVRSVSTDQISAGMSKYEQMLTSVRLITNAKKSDGTKYTQAEAYKSIEQLGKYSDQTSYSLNQMTDALSKMTAAGVSLDDATKSVMGIANACANAGINATDAARAFFNLSQAYGSGSLKYTDYRSLELLNMADAQFKEQMLKAAVVEGTLKEVKKGVYKTVNKKGTKVTGGKQVTEKNLSESLKYGWATNDVMNTLFGKNYYWGALDVEEGVKQIQEAHSHEKALELLKDEYKDIAIEFEKLEKEVGQEKALEQLKKKHGSVAEDLARDLKDLESACDHDTALDKLKKKYGEVGYNAYMAAKEARNFTDVINTIKDVVATGWSKTWEKLFGQLDTATKFFTMLSGEDYDKDGNALGLANAIFAIGEWRSEALETWDEGGGGDVFRSGIIELNRLLGDLVMMFTELLPSSEDFGEMLFVLTMHFQEGVLAIRHWVWQLNNWLNDKRFDNGATSRLEIIQKILSNVTSVFTIAEKALGIITGGIEKAFVTLEPVFDAILFGLLGITTPISELANNDKPFNDLANAIDNFFIAIKPISDALAPIIRGLGYILGEVIKFFTIDAGISLVTMNIELVSDALGLLIELFGGTSAQKLNQGQGVIEGISAGIKDLLDACRDGIGALGEFFDVLMKDIRALLGLPTETAEGSVEAAENGGIFSGIKTFFDTNQFIQNAKTWFEQAKTDITKWFVNLPSELNKFFTGLFYDTNIVSSYGPKGLTSHVEYVETPLKKWLDGVVETVSDFILNIPANLLKGLGGAIDFFGGIIEAIFGKKEDQKTAAAKNDKDQASASNVVSKWIDDFLVKLRIKIHLIPYHIRKFINRAKATARRSWATIKEWFNTSEFGKTIQSWGTTIAEKIKDFIVNLPTTIKDLIKQAGDLGRRIIDSIKEFFSPSDIGDTVGREIKEGVKGINLEDILSTISDIGKEIVNQFLSFFTGTDDFEKNVQWFSQQIGVFISSIPSRIKSGINLAVQGIGNLWNNIFQALVGTDEKGNPINSRVSKKLEELTDKDGKLNISLSDIVGLINKLIEDIQEAIHVAWTGFLNSVFGDGSNSAQTSQQMETEKSEWIKFGEELGRIVVEIFNSLPGWIVEGINTAVGLVSTGLEKITGFLTENIDKLTGQEAEDAIDTLSNNLDETATKDEGTIQGSLAKLGTTIMDLITKTLPGFISAGFTWVRTKWSDEWMPSVCKIFDDINSNEDFKKAIDQAGQNIVAWIEGLPKTIENAFWKVKKEITKWIKGYDLEDPLVEHFQVRKLAKKSNENDNNTVWGSIKQLAVDIGDAFKRIFEEHIKPAVVDAITNLPTWLTEGFNVAVNLVGGAFEWMTNWFDMHKTAQDIIESVDKETSNIGSEVAETVGNNASEVEKDTQKSSSLFEALKKVGASIAKLITETIPKFIISAFDYVINTDFVNGIWDTIKSLPETISNAIKRLGRILAGTESVTDIVSDVFLKHKGDRKHLDEKMQTELDKEAGGTKDVITEALTSTFDVKGIITDFITVKIPAFITSAFDTVKKDWPAWIANLYNIFSEVKITPEEAREKFSIANISKSIIDFITVTIPTFISTGFTNLIKDPFGWIADLYNIFTGVDASKTATAMKGDDIKNAIVAFITVKIPAFINDAFKTVKENWTKWITSLEGIFNGVDWSKVTIDTVGIINKITEAIKNIPTDIKGAIEWLTKSIGEATKDTKNPSDALVIDSDETKQQLDKNADEIKEAAEESSLWETFEAISVAITELITATFNKVGPAIIEGWNNTIKTIGKILSVISRWFSGEKLSDAITEIFPDADVDLKKVIDDFAANVSDLLVTRIPKFLGSSIGKIAGSLGDIATEFWTALTTAFAASNQEKDPAETVVENAEGTLEDVNSLAAGAKTGVQKAEEACDAVIGTVGNIWDVVKNLAFSVDENGNIVGLSLTTWILIVFETLEKLSEFINSLKIGKSAEAYEAQNSVGAIIRIAIEALMVGMVFATLASQMNEGQFDQAMTAFDKLGQLIKTIMDNAVALKGLETADDLIETVGEGLGRSGSKAGYAISYGLKAAKVGGIYLISQNIMNLIDTLGGTFASIGASIDFFATQLKSATDKLVEITPNMTSTIECLTDVVTIANKIKEINAYKEDIEIGQSVVGILNSMFNPFIRATTGKDVHTKEVVASISRLINLTDEIDAFVKFVKKDDTYENFKWALSTLGASLSLFHSSAFASGEPIEISESSIQNAVDFLSAILGDNKLMGLAETLVENKTAFRQSPSDIQAATERLIVFAGAIIQLGAATKDIEEGMGEHISTFLSELEKIEIDNAGIGQSTTEIVANIATKFEILAGGLEAMGSAAETFNDEKLKTTEYALTMLLDVARKASTFGTSLLGALLSGTSNLSTFSSSISVLGQGLFEFYKAINGQDPKTGEQVVANITLDNVRSSLQIIDTLAEVARMLANNSDGVDNLLKLAGGDTYTQYVDAEKYFGEISNNFSFLMQAALYAFNEVAADLDKFGDAEEKAGSFKSLGEDDFAKIKQAFLLFFELCRSVAILGDTNMDYGRLKSMFKMFRLVDENGKDNIYSLSTLIANFFSDLHTTFVAKEIYSYEDVELLTMAIDSFSSIIEALGSLYIKNASDVWVTAINGDTAQGLLNALTILTENYTIIGNFLTTMSGLQAFDFDKTRQILTLVKLLGETLAVFGAQTTVYYSHMNLVDQGLNEMLLINSNQLSDALSTIVSALDSFLNDPLNADSLKSIGSNVAVYLFQGIQEAFDDPLQPFQPQITPVLKLDQAKKDMMDMFGSENLVDVSFGTLIASSIKDVFTNQEQPIVHDYTSQFEAVERQIGVLSTDIQSVATSVSNIKLYLDTGVLVGQMSQPIIEEMVNSRVLWNLKNAGYIPVEQ